jgi:hypothetical protein
VLACQALAILASLGCGLFENLVQLGILNEKDTTEGIDSADFDALLSKKRRSRE